MPLVDATGDVGVTLCSEDRRRAGVGVHAGEVRGRQCKAAVLVMDRFRVVQEEGAFGLIEQSLLSAEYEGAEFEAGVHVREERRQPCSEAAVLEVEQAAHPSSHGNGLEEAGPRSCPRKCPTASAGRQNHPA